MTINKITTNSQLMTEVNNKMTISKLITLINRIAIISKLTILSLEMIKINNRAMTNNRMTPIRVPTMA